MVHSLRSCPILVGRVKSSRVPDIACSLLTFGLPGNQRNRYCSGQFGVHPGNPVSGFVYFWRSYTATASGSTTRRERCIGCSCVFEYTITREAAGGGHSAFFLNNAGAAASAKIRARANLDRALIEAIEPVHCPACGIFQPNMVSVLRERHGKRYEPNKFASERIAIPVADAWQAARAANTIESYTKFIEMWPARQEGIDVGDFVQQSPGMFSWLAKQKLKEMKHPAIFGKLASGVLWIVWGIIFLLFIIYIFITVMDR
jgi:hypothetical protein